MKFIFATLAVTVLVGLAFAIERPTVPKADLPAVIPKVPAGAEMVTLGFGCFWHGEAVFRQVPGVLFVTVGYMGGTTTNPSYQDVSGGTTGHTEVSRVVFDPKQTSFEKLLQGFWAAQHPTNAGSTHGRSVIFCSSPQQLAIAEKSKAEEAKKYANPIVTQIAPAGEFYAAEEYHQNYYQKHGGACAKSE